MDNTVENMVENVENRVEKRRTWQILAQASLVVTVLTLGGCTRRPVLYPRSTTPVASPQEQDAIIDACMDSARKAGTESWEDVGRPVARAGTGGAVGAAAGAVGAATWAASVGRGIGAGAAAGATSSLLWGLFDREDATMFRGYVERCLADRGFDTVGWR